MNGKTDHPDRILSETRNGDSCPFEDRSEPAHGHVSSPADRDNEALASEEQAKLTPGTVVEILKQGNRDFAGGALTVRNNTKRTREAALWQYPKAVILSCIDSRIPVEDVFHRGIGELFVVRIAGNYVNADVLGCLEFACKVSGAKLIVVLGHEHCGAIKSVIDHVQLGHVTAMLSNLQPAVARANETFRGEKNVYSQYTTCGSRNPLGKRYSEKNGRQRRNRNRRRHLPHENGSRYFFMRCCARVFIERLSQEPVVNTCRTGNPVRDYPFPFRIRKKRTALPTSSTCCRTAT